MSKKPQTKQNPKGAKIQIVDQQTQPFLRTLQKRVRNINKKLTQIAELSTKKEDLKPEQIEKINRKNQYNQQKSRLQQMSNYYRQTLVQNADYYRNLQLKELDNVATSIAIFNTGRFKEHAKLQQFHNLFIGSTSVNITLNERIAQVSGTIKKVFLDQKLRKAMFAFVQQNGNKKVQEEDIQQVATKEQINLVSTLIADTPAQKEEPVVVHAKVQQQRSPVKPVVVQQTKPVQPNHQQVPASQSNNQKPVEDKKVQGVEQEKRPRGQPRTRNNRNRDGNRQYRDRNNNVNGQRKYKPKYEPKGGEQQKPQRQSPSDDDQQIQPEVRNFRRDQIRRLEDEGFTVIGKPKPKAKQGQKQWHEHTHGKKHHHHKQNL